MQNTFVEDNVKFTRYASTLSANQQNTLSGIQENAITLYERGFNVFPIPSARDWILRRETKKSPYKIGPLYNTRLHYANGCHCSICRGYNFSTLFEGSNLAIMCGATSGNLLAIDCDTVEDYEIIGKNLVQRVGPSFWTYTTHRGGVYLFRIQEGEVENKSNVNGFRNVQIWGHHQYIVVPPSIHPKGTVYRWVSPEPLNMLPHDTLPAITIENLKWLGIKLRKDRKIVNYMIEHEGDFPEYAQRLSRANRQTLLHGAKEGSRNSKLVALAADLAGIGLGRDDARSALLMGAGNCTPSYEDSIDPIIAWAFSKERQPSKEHRLDARLNSKRQSWEQAEIFCHSFNWQNEYGSRKAPYARCVFEACIERARVDYRNTVFRASVRELALKSGLNKETVSKYLKELVQHEILVHTRCEKNSGAKLFMFGPKVGQPPYSIPPLDMILYGDCPTRYMPTLDVERDVFSNLGIYAYKIWHELLTRPIENAYQLSKRMKINKGTAKATLDRLVRNCLVYYSEAEGVYYGNTVTDAQLERISVDLGTYKKTGNKRMQFANEREKYANRIIWRAKEDYKKESARLGNIQYTH